MSATDAHSNFVSIRGMDRVSVLRAAWMRARAGMSGAAIPSMLNMQFDEELASRTVRTRYIYFFQYRLLGLDLRGDHVDPSAFDEVYGRGAFAECVAAVCA